MVPASIIAAKRDGRELTADEIQFMIHGFVSQRIPNYQISAWAMAILCRGMNEAEIAALTDAMTSSGSRLTRASDRLRVDKHSTGGLGDKTSLILAPLLACCDLDVPMLSGRGLGFTGGTLDKLESFPGYRTDLDEEEINRQLSAIGCVITGTTPGIAPADRLLYALRDVTATVPSVALITASIMSKKLAESLDALVLDVKFGSGAFMRELEQARELSRSLVSTGQRMRLPTCALISDMNQPLGKMVGNACEVNESIDVLLGGGPPDVRELTLRLGAEILLAIGLAQSLDAAQAKLSQILDSGSAYDRFQRMVEMQGGRWDQRLPLGHRSALEATNTGYVASFDGQLLGQAVVELGGGRKQLGDSINPRVGLEMLVRIGDPVDLHQPLVAIFHERDSNINASEQLIRKAIVLTGHPTAARPLFA